MALFDDLQAAATGFTPGPTGPSPIMDSPEISNFYASRANLVGSSPITKSLIAESGQVVDRDAQARAAEVARLKELSNPENYQRVVREDGGFDFFDPSGKKISAMAYAQATGKGLEGAITGSTNVKDIQALKDYSLVKKTYELASNGDQEGIKNLMNDNPILKDKVPQDLIDTLHQVYPELFFVESGDTEADWSTGIRNFGAEKLGIGQKIPREFSSNQYQSPGQYLSTLR